MLPKNYKTAFCSCGKTYRHVIAHRRLFDDGTQNPGEYMGGPAVVALSDGTVFLRNGGGVRCRFFHLDALWRALNEAGVLAWEEFAERAGWRVFRCDFCNSDCFQKPLSKSFGNSERRLSFCKHECADAFAALMPTTTTAV